MVLSAPSPKEHPTVLADWLEFAALGSADQAVSFMALMDAVDIDQDFEIEDWSEGDALSEEVMMLAVDEINERKKIMGTSYPFTIQDNGTILRADEVSEIGGTVYLACLIISHFRNSEILDDTIFLDIAADPADLFQICATLCAAGHCGGPAISFGWPRPDRSSFSEKLAQVYQAFGEGKPRAEPMPTAPDRIKDGGIDVIAWRETPDCLPGKYYLLGQAATGGNWKDKSVVNDMNLFHWAWFEVAPPSTPNPAMFVPFCLKELREEDGQFTRQELKIEQMQWLTMEFGLFFYRYRIPLHAALAPSLEAEGVHPLERLDDIPMLEAWVSIFRQYLIAAFRQ